MLSSESAVKVKICGITRVEDACMAVDAGADMLGLNFYPKSKRFITVDAARQMAETLRRNGPLLIGVFVNATAADICAIVETVGLDGIQLSGDEAPDQLKLLGARAFKGLRPSDAVQAAEQVQQFGLDPVDAHLPSLLLDAYHPGAYGGTGLQVDVPLALSVRDATARLMLAGGLTPDNVAEIVAQVQPWGVDVASGVEDSVPGIKSEAKTRALIRNARNALADSVHPMEQDAPVTQDDQP